MTINMTRIDTTNKAITIQTRINTTINPPKITITTMNTTKTSK